MTDADPDVCMAGCVNVTRKSWSGVRRQLEFRLAPTVRFSASAQCNEHIAYCQYWTCPDGSTTHIPQQYAAPSHLAMVRVGQHRGKHLVGIGHATIFLFLIEAAWAVDRLGTEILSSVHVEQASLSRNLNCSSARRDSRAPAPH